MDGGLIILMKTDAANSIPSDNFRSTWRKDMSPRKRRREGRENRQHPSRTIINAICPRPRLHLSTAPLPDQSTKLGMPVCVGACISPTLGNNTNCTSVLWDVVYARHVFFWSVVASARPLGVRCHCGLDHKLDDRNWLAHHSRVRRTNCLFPLVSYYNTRIVTKTPLDGNKKGYNCHCTPSKDAARLHALAVQLL